MAVSAATLVLDQIDPILSLDTTITAAITRRVDAEIAIQGYNTLTMADAEQAYIGDLVLQAMLPRLILKFSQELKRAKGGPAEVEFQAAIDFLKALQAQLKEKVKQTASQVDPGDTVDYSNVAWPSTGFISL
jgi:hypothetical protein